MSDIKIVSIDAIDIRFPTGKYNIGSDGMNPDPDYSTAYVILRTDHPGGLEGHGLTFTIGRGNDLCVMAIKALSELVIGKKLPDITSDMAGFWRMITGDSQYRWLGPEKGVIHMATAAIVNAMWDLYAKVEEKPLWELIAGMTCEQLLSCIDFTYITDVITPAEAMQILEKNKPSKADRIEKLKRSGYPAYTTSAGWLGCDKDKIRSLCRQFSREGWTSLKMKIGPDMAENITRAEIIRTEIGNEVPLLMDANQIWDVNEAFVNIKQLARFNPWWFEEPTSPDDILGHKKIADAVKPVRIATGEHAANRIVFK